ncbi:MAG: hypothetical protein WAO35_19705 [Terriglobia bacterium]
MGDKNSQIFENMEVSLIGVRREVTEKKDVKNAGCSDYLYENTFDNDKMSWRQSASFERKYLDCAITDFGREGFGEENV